ncbi:MAG: amino acid permease [Bacteroidetes bacterium]|nr:amino acid permease [Bacteroidota bacterium]
MYSLNKDKRLGFGTSSVFFTAISTILGAILFLRFGFAVGTLGFGGAILIVILGHLVTIPTALAISEIATNKKVEGGGAYYIVSRSFGLNIGTTIGIALYLSQAISVAFYIIAFTESFEPVFNWVNESYGLILPRQAVSLPAMALLSILILTKGAGYGMKALYVVVILLFGSIILFFAGTATGVATSEIQGFSGMFKNMDDFFLVFAIIFPAFTGMAAGLGLSGDLKNPGKSIPNGTIWATFAGMIIYVIIIWKLAVSASADELINEQLIMSRIGMYGWLAIPIGLAASTISSAIGSILVAPRTLQALGSDESFPFKNVNRFFAKGQAETNEPFNAAIISIIIAFVFVALGNVNSVAIIISMFFMVTYGAICLISFLNHFGSDPSYRPTFRSKWYFSLIGFLLSIWLMFKINPFYAWVSIIIMVLIYLGISKYHKNRSGLQSIFKGAIFQLNRKIQIYLQKSGNVQKAESWRPSAICVSTNSLDRNAAFRFLNWVSYKYGFGTYIYLVEGFYTKDTHRQARTILKKLLLRSGNRNNSVYLDTIISPSYTSALAQAIQLPGISGMANNMVIFEYDKKNITELKTIIDNFYLTLAGNYDVCILGSSDKRILPKSPIHVWIRSFDYENSNLMILLSYIIWGHPDWQQSSIKIFEICKAHEIDATRDNLVELVKSGRIPITPKNIEIIQKDEAVSSKKLINEKSQEAGLTIIGIRPEHLDIYEIDLFKGYDNIGNVIFVNSREVKEIE